MLPRRCVTTTLTALVLLYGLAACSTGSEPTRPDQGWYRAQEIVQRYGEVNDPAVTSYLKEFSGRLMSPLRRRKPELPPLHVRVIDWNEAQALALGSGEIAISKGMIRRMATEAEFAFVLSHELAHEVLGHTKTFDDYSVQEFADEHAALEREADEYALGIAALAGYDPRVAPYALLHAYGSSSDPDKRDPAYPSLRSRLGYINQAIMQSGWRPPGTTDRRIFQQFRRALLAEKK